MLKRRNIGKWLLLMIFVLIFSSGSASADDEQLDDSEYDEELPAFDYDPEIFEKIKNETWFITTRGTMPVIRDADELVEWKKKAGKCIHSFRDELQPYMKSNGGPLNGFGYFRAGYLNVFIDAKSLESVNDSFIDEIYLIISDHCEQEGISEVPVVFMKSTITLLEEEPSESPGEDEEVIDGESNDSEYTDEEVSNQHQLLPDYGPFRDDVIEEVKKSPHFIATRGALPNITDDDEKVEWGNSVFICSQSLSNPSSPNTGINPYFAEFGGPVVLFGYSGEGYIEVGLESESPEKVNESLIDEIYQVIDETL